jgi:hypothetical protein
MEPGRESGMTTELADSTKHGEKSFLRQVLGLKRIFHHTETLGIDSITMQAVKKFKSGGTASPGQTQRLVF